MMTNSQKKDIFSTVMIAIIGLAVIYLIKRRLNAFSLSIFSIVVVISTTLPAQIRKRKQRRLITVLLNQNNTTILEEIYKATQITQNQLKHYQILGDGISAANLYKIEAIILFQSDLKK